MVWWNLVLVNCQLPILVFMNVHMYIMYCVCLLPDSSTFLVHLFKPASFRVPSLNLWRLVLDAIIVAALAQGQRGVTPGKPRGSQGLHNAMIELSNRHPVRKRSSLMPSKKGSYSHPNHLNISKHIPSWIILVTSCTVLANSDHVERTNGHNHQAHDIFIHRPYRLVAICTRFTGTCELSMAIKIRRRIFYHSYHQLNLIAELLWMGIPQ